MFVFRTTWFKVHSFSLEQFRQENETAMHAAYSLVESSNSVKHRTINQSNLFFFHLKGQTTSF